MSPFAGETSDDLRMASTPDRAVIPCQSHYSTAESRDAAAHAQHAVAHQAGHRAGRGWPVSLNECQALGAKGQALHKIYSRW